VARRLPDAPTAHTLEEIQHFGDRVVEAVSNTPRPVILVLTAIVLAAATYGGLNQYRGSRTSEAVAALEEVRTSYLEAMGGGPGSVQVPEPANPETARSVRNEYAGRYEQVASDHAGTASASLALLEAGQLRRELGDIEAAQETWRRAAAAADGWLRAMAYERVAQADEEAGRFGAAAAAYTQAADISGYPRRYQAMAKAARCWADAGDASQAVALYKRIQAESPETRLAPHVSARLRELEASQR
jgi:hypothetical protein